MIFVTTAVTNEKKNKKRKQEGNCRQVVDEKEKEREREERKVIVYGREQ